MIQDILPHIFHNEFKPQPVEPDSYICIYKNGCVLLAADQEEARLPRRKELELPDADTQCRFLFTIDEQTFFLLFDYEVEENNSWHYVSMMDVRYMEPVWMVFACSLGDQLNRWFDRNRFCGHCGAPTKLHNTERAFACEKCGHVIYPDLPPSVIVGITDGDRILLTKYAKGKFKRYALVAGYTEFGETLEETVIREVQEEVGLKVKNIRYYKSQPWPFSGALLVGYFAELDGSDKVTLQESELAEGTWFKREDIPIMDSRLSLTNEMIEMFRLNQI